MYIRSMCIHECNYEIVIGWLKTDQMMYSIHLKLVKTDFISN